MIFKLAVLSTDCTKNLLRYLQIVQVLFFSVSCRHLHKLQFAQNLLCDMWIVQRQLHDLLITRQIALQIVQIYQIVWDMIQ